MNASPFHILAKDSLEKQQSLTKQLLTLMKQEYKILNTNEINPLDKIASDKQPLIVELDALNQHWLGLIAAEAVATHQEEPKEQEGIAKFLDNCDEMNNTSLSDQWLELQNMAKDCQKINSINGAIITLRYQSTQQTLSILRGQVPGDAIYGPQGNNTAGYSGGNALAKA